MNRQIKFRALDEQNNVMHYEFQFIKSGDTGSDWIIFTSDKQAISSKEHPFENPYFQQQFKIMQFTGLHDYDGKEIYEGDIVYIAGYGNYTVEWPFIDLYEASFHDDIGKILGNIHQNPELLK